MKRLVLLLIAVSAMAFLALRPEVTLRAQSVGNTVQTKENLDLPYDAAGENSEEENLPEIVVFYGQNFEGDGIFYSIDRSMSMQNQGELAIAKREVTRNIKEFSPGVQFGIVFFDSGVIKFPTSGTPMQADESKKQSAISWVQGMAGGAGSEITSGLLAVLQFSNRSSAERNVIIYVGDGGGSNESLLAKVRGKNSKNAQINCIGVLNLSDKNRQFLQQLARGNSGTYTEITR